MFRKEKFFFRQKEIIGKALMTVIASEILSHSFSFFEFLLPITVLASFAACATAGPT